MGHVLHLHRVCYPDLVTSWILFEDFAMPYAMELSQISFMVYMYLFDVKHTACPSRLFRVALEEALHSILP